MCKTEQRLVDTFMDRREPCWRSGRRCSETSVYLGHLCGMEGGGVVTCGGGHPRVLGGHGFCRGAGRGDAHGMDGASGGVGLRRLGGGGGLCQREFLLSLC